MGSLTIRHARHIALVAFLLFALGFQLVHAQTLSGTWTGIWNGQSVNLTTIKNANIETLSDATLVGSLTNFQTNNPSYSCLNGETLSVWTAPSEYPNEYIVHNGVQGPQCAYFTAIISVPSAATASPATVSPTAAGTTITAHAAQALTTGFAAVGIALIAVYVVIVILAFALFIWMIIDCAKYQQEDKVVWILIILLIGIIGPLIYYFVAKRPRDRQRKMNPQKQNVQPPSQ